MYILDPYFQRVVYIRPPISEPSLSTPMTFREGVTPPGLSLGKVRQLRLPPRGESRVRDACWGKSCLGRVHFDTTAYHVTGFKL